MGGSFESPRTNSVMSLYKACIFSYLLVAHILHIQFHLQDDGPLRVL